MSRISIRRVEELTWVDVPDDAPGISDNNTGSSAERSDTYCVHHNGTEENPQLFEIRLPPNQTVPPHAHEHDEIIYIAGGEMRLGNTVLRPGSSISILGGTVYSFSAGPEGVHFLNFRPCVDTSYLTVDEAKATRSA